MRTYGLIWMKGGLAAILSAGCSADLAQTGAPGAIAGYHSASAFSPVGHSLSGLPDGRVRVRAAATPGTPPARVEKIAMARAAEYGIEQSKKAFTASAPSHSVSCGKSSYIQKGEKVPMRPTDLRVVEIDVSYDTAPGTPGARLTKETAEALKAELAAEAVPSDAEAANAADIARQCNR